MGMQDQMVFFLSPRHRSIDEKDFMYCAIVCIYTENTLQYRHTMVQRMLNTRVKHNFSEEPFLNEQKTNGISKLNSLKCSSTKSHVTSQSLTSFKSPTIA